MQVNFDPCGSRGIRTNRICKVDMEMDIAIANWFYFYHFKALSADLWPLSCSLIKRPSWHIQMQNILSYGDIIVAEMFANVSGDCIST